MRSQNLKLSSLRNVDPTRWRAEIIAAFKLEGGYVRPTADRLNISERTLSRWLAEDTDLRISRRNLIKDIEKQEKEAS
jgi:Homeodomain-like domain-containing protein